MFLDAKGDRWFKVGLHIHTSLSDGKCTPKEAAEIYRDAGFDAIAITDHWKFHPEGSLSGLAIISGCEYHIGMDSAEGVMHIVGLGMEKDPCVPENATHQEIIDAIRDNGGIAVLAHPAWSLNTIDSVKSLKGFSATEIYNSVSDAHQSSRPYSGYFVDVLANTGIFYHLLATDDTHYYDGSDETKSFVMVRAEENSSKTLLEAICKGEFYATQGPQLFVHREGDKIKVSCSPCTKIAFLSNAVWAPDKMLRGDDLTGAEYQLKAHEKWVRVEVWDADGNCAWSDILPL